MQPHFTLLAEAQLQLKKFSVSIFKSDFIARKNGQFAQKETNTVKLYDLRHAQL